MQNFHLPTRIFTVLFVHVVLLLVILTGYLVFSFRLSMQSINVSSQFYADLYAGNLEGKIENADKILERIVYDNSDYTILKSSRSEERYYALVRIKQLLKTSLVFDEYIDFIAVGESDYKSFLLVNNSPVSYTLSQEAKNFVLSCADKGRIKSCWDIREMDGESYVYRMFVWQGSAIGIFIKKDSFMDLGNQINDGRSHMMVLTASGSSSSITVGTTDITKGRTTAFERPLSDGDLSLTIYADYKEIKNHLRVSRYVMMGFILLTFIYGIYMARFIASEIVRLRIRSYEKELELNQAELKTIKLQIRPHFFLNALTTISSLSMQKNNEAIIKYIDNLSSNIRYMFKSGLHTVSLREELNHVETYFAMQELKYPDCVFYFIESDNSLDDYPIPQMIIHTIIENEYKYAVSVDKMLSIIIKCHTVEHDGENCLCIEIEDDGKGYPEEVLLDFGSGSLKDGSRVGLWSIRKMMEIMYGQKDLFVIDNVKPHGCINRIIVPPCAKSQVNE